MTDRLPRYSEDSIAEPPPIESLQIFVSHCSADAIARELVDLICQEIYGGDGAEVERRVFFSSDGKTGLRAGEHFGQMLKKIATAETVVAVVTLHTQSSTAMQAEMSLANYKNKLMPVVARRAYRSLLQWPFDQLQAPGLDSTDDIRQLLSDLAKVAGRSFRWTEDTRKRCEALAAFARKHCSLAPQPDRWWKRAAAAMLLLLIAGSAASYGAGVRSAGPRLYPVDAAGQTIEGTPIRVVYEGTLPRKRLSARLHEILVALGSSAETKDVHRIFLSALETPNREWAIPGDTKAVLEAIVRKWDGGSSKIGDAEKKACKDLPVDLDQEWCAAVESALGNDGRKFDDTHFAVARIGGATEGVQPPAVVLTPGKEVPGKPKWIVDSISTVVIRVEK